MAIAAPIRIKSKRMSIGTKRGIVLPRRVTSACLSALTGGMALVAIDAVIDVARHARVLEVRRIVTAMATRALEYGVVVGIDVARRAHSVRVAMVHGELRVLRVIEGRTGPRRGVVAVLARRREELRLSGVARIRGVVVIRLMAAVTGGWQRRIVRVDVAVCALARRNGV